MTDEQEARIRFGVIQQPGQTSREAAVHNLAEEKDEKKKKKKNASFGSLSPRRAEIYHLSFQGANASAIHTPHGALGIGGIVGTDGATSRPSIHSSIHPFTRFTCGSRQQTEFLSLCLTGG